MKPQELFPVPFRAIPLAVPESESSDSDSEVSDSAQESGNELVNVTHENASDDQDHDHIDSEEFIWHSPGCTG